MNSLTKRLAAATIALLMTSGVCAAALVTDNFAFGGIVSAAASLTDDGLVLESGETVELGFTVYNSDSQEVTNSVIGSTASVTYDGSQYSIVLSVSGDDVAYVVVGSSNASEPSSGTVTNKLSSTYLPQTNSIAVYDADFNTLLSGTIVFDFSEYETEDSEDSSTAVLSLDLSEAIDYTLEYAVYKTGTTESSHSSSYFATPMTVSYADGAYTVTFSVYTGDSSGNTVEYGGFTYGSDATEATFVSADEENGTVTYSMTFEEIPETLTLTITSMTINSSYVHSNTSLDIAFDAESLEPILESDTTYEIGYAVYRVGTTTSSMLASYVDSTATVTYADGLYAIDVTVNSYSDIPYLYYINTDGETVTAEIVESDTDTNTATFRIYAESISDAVTISAYVQQMADLGYTATQSVDLSFDLSTIVLAADNDDTDDNTDNSDNNSGDSSEIADGIYKLSVEVYKVDLSETSMADGAINHIAKVEVVDGVYYLTLNLHGISVGTDDGYLSSLSYYDEDGNLVEATVISTQTGTDGEEYPDEVTIVLSEADIENGYAVLSVFIPYMEEIAAGSGTQTVNLVFDWSTLTATTADDSDFTADETSSSDGNTDDSNDTDSSNADSSGGDSDDSDSDEDDDSDEDNDSEEDTDSDEDSDSEDEDSSSTASTASPSSDTNPSTRVAVTGSISALLAAVIVVSKKKKG